MPKRTAPPRPHRRYGDLGSQPVLDQTSAQAERAGDRITVDRTSGCWVYEGPKANGYGVLGEQPAHRFVWQMVNQKKIPAGMMLHHMCLNRACCNPEHLEPLTPGEHSSLHNMNRGAVGWLTYHGTRRPPVRTHWRQALPVPELRAP